MALSRGMALSIVNVVDADAECRRRITSSISKYVPTGWAGGVRTLGFIASQVVKAIPKGTVWVQPSAEQDDLVCYGIRDATIAALEKAIAKAGLDDDLRSITDVGYVVRDEPFVHTATSVTIVKRHTYVFDWHATLETRNPMIYRSAKAFEDNDASIPFATFKGFD